MALQLLLFSSDAKTALLLGKVLSDLDIEVEFCSEIFASVERLTRQKFDVIIVDWDDEPEASFLLKTARELKTTRDCLTLTLVSDAAEAACALQAGAHGTLHKPIVLCEVAEALSTVRNLVLTQRDETPGQSVSSCDAVSLCDNEAATTSGASSPAIGGKVPPEDQARPAIAHHQTLGVEPLRVTRNSQAGVSSLPEPCENRLFPFLPYNRKPHNKKPRIKTAGRNLGMRLAILSCALVGAAVLYVLAPGSSYGERLHSVVISVLDGGVANSETVADAEIEAHNVLSDQVPVSPKPREGRDLHSVKSRIATAELPDIRVIPNLAAPRTLASEYAAPLQPPAQADRQPPPLSSQTQVKVPESLRTLAVESRSGDANPRPSSSPSLLQPIVLTEEMSRKLLISDVAPIYPEAALRAGLQGAVVLQAWIAQDGSIRDLKLVHGYFVLGRAACDAVKQWRFRPFYLHGQAVEAQTLLTVIFKLPSPGSSLSKPTSDSISSLVDPSKP
jgi:TonB family protein